MGCKGSLVRIQSTRQKLAVFAANFYFSSCSMCSIFKMKQVILTIIGLAMLVLFFLLPKNQSWFKGRIVGYWNDFNFQRHNLDPEVRRIERWGNSYTFSKQIAEHLSKQGAIGNTLVLM